MPLLTTTTGSRMRKAWLSASRSGLGSKKLCSTNWSVASGNVRPDEAVCQMRARTGLPRRSLTCIEGLIK